MTPLTVTLLGLREDASCVVVVTMPPRLTVLAWFGCSVSHAEFASLAPAMPPLTAFACMGTFSDCAQADRHIRQIVEIIMASI